MKKTLVTFIIASVVFEIIALVVLGLKTSASLWLLNVLVVLAVLYVIIRGLIGWVREVKRDLPQVQKGIVVKKRHWHFL